MSQREPSLFRAALKAIAWLWLLSALWSIKHSIDAFAKKFPTPHVEVQSNPKEAP